MSCAQQDAALRLAGLRILVVDDDDDSRLLLAATLRREGAEVEVVGSAASALTALEAGPAPSVVISDIGMPEVDGYELIRRIRDRDEGGGGNVPAVAITAFTETESRERAITAGFQAFVSKPLDREILIATVARLVED